MKAKSCEAIIKKKKESLVSGTAERFMGASGRNAASGLVPGSE